ncbi:MAG: Exodeoxyribonuclease 7 large subunit [Thermoanaerobacterales bacterium 50_218]|nr:MAG: Exodeoxyribonuclease 7 large subunit [Thermoanaerobacterales bacterium 50_218]HAA90462.1 exodeoxyribonuclease VII large subunit [Peptococcaceae bacterium]
MVVRRIYSVGEVTSYLRNLLDGDPLLSNIWVRGEISNFKKHTSGHMYFVLKDDSSCLRCVMFRSRNSQLLFVPTNGMRVIARGSVSVYERDGLYQLYVEELSPDGVGSLYLAYCQLKARLQAEGLFAAEKKKPLPFLPRKVGIVTSPNGAAWRDLVSVMRRRFPGIPIVLAPAAVQGEQAPEQIVKALEILNQRSDIDVIIVGRGGGSLEELWAFNTEEVARAIFASRIPVVSAVGHETDFTITDLVADLRAPTPSAAAELVVPCRAELERKVRSLQNRLLQALDRYYRSKQLRVKQVAGRNMVGLLQNLIAAHKQELRLCSLRLLQRIRILRENWRSQVKLLAGKLDLLSPLTVLERGYSLCWDPQKEQLVRSRKQVQKGDLIEVILSDGSLECLIEEVKEGSRWKSKGPGLKK